VIGAGPAGQSVGRIERGSTPALAGEPARLARAPLDVHPAEPLLAGFARGRVLAALVDAGRLLKREDRPQIARLIRLGLFVAVVLRGRHDSAPEVTVAIEAQQRVDQERGIGCGSRRQVTLLSRTLVALARRDGRAVPATPRSRL
jgi:hypothetical protein